MNCTYFCNKILYHNHESFRKQFYGYSLEFFSKPYFQNKKICKIQMYKEKLTNLLNLFFSFVDNFLTPLLCKINVPSIFNIFEFFFGSYPIGKYSKFSFKASLKIINSSVDEPVRYFSASYWTSSYWFKKILSCSTLMRRSVSLNSYGLFQPIGPNFLRSWTIAWKKQRENRSFLKDSDCFDVV